MAHLTMTHTTSHATPHMANDLATSHPVHEHATSHAQGAIPKFRLAELVRDALPALYAQDGAILTTEQRFALHAITGCRSSAFGERVLQCADCSYRLHCPRSCGHRSCPRCQHAAASAWLARQQAKLVPVDYYLATFTLPEGLRLLAMQQPKAVYDALFDAAASTLKSFGQHHRKLSAELGFCAVLHTHSRRLDFHPHLHVVVPGGGVDPKRRQWRKLTGRYLFNGRQLASVFRARMIEALKCAGLTIPVGLPKKWIVHCAHVGNGLPALQYLSRYLYRGVISEKQLVDYDRAAGTVTFRYQDGKSKRPALRTLGLLDFVRLLLRHVLPKGYRRVRDFGFLHANAKKLLTLLQLVLRVVIAPSAPRIARPFFCPHCHAPMVVCAMTPRSVRVT